MTWSKSLLIRSFVVAGMVFRAGVVIWDEIGKAFFTPQIPAQSHRPTSVHLRTPVQEIKSMRRTVGYCGNNECNEFTKGVFLLNHPSHFYCAGCALEGEVIPEVGYFEGIASDGVFKQVTVEFNYDPVLRVFKDKAQVVDDSILGRHQLYTLQSPMIKTSKRALKVAEGMLANLNRYRGLVNEATGLPGTKETILSFDATREQFATDCERLGKEWADSPLSTTYVFPGPDDQVEGEAS